MERLPETIDAEHVDSSQVDANLRLEVDEIQQELRSIRADLRKLAELVKSARIVFGTSYGSPVPAANQEVDKWEKLKAKLGGKMAQIIDALQLSGKATRTQLKNQTGGALTTVDQAVYKLRDMGLLVKNGDGWSLKP